MKSYSKANIEERITTFAKKWYPQMELIDFIEKYILVSSL